MQNLTVFEKQNANFGLVPITTTRIGFEFLEKLQLKI
jgi:hypothetical protein